MRRCFVRGILPAACLALAAACGGGGGGGGQADPATLVVNGSFEEPDVPRGATLVTPGAWNLPGWTPVNGNGVAIIDNLAVSPGAALEAHEGGQFLELDVSGNGGISQAIATVPGTSYDVSFAYMPRPGLGVSTSRIAFYLNDNFLREVPFDNVSPRPWVEYYFRFTATGASTTLKFLAAGDGDGFGGFLDSVRVIERSDPGAALSSGNPTP